MAKKSLARWAGRRAKKVKEKTRYMRIKRPKRRSSGRKEAKIAPAPWQEFIEI